MNDLHICSISGGKDSTALYCLMVEQFGKGFLPLFADTGNEHPVTLNYVRNLHLMAGGPPVVMVSGDFTEKLAERRGIEPTGTPFLDMMLWKGRAPSTKAQFCTEWLKLWPMLLYLEMNYPRHNWVMYSGIRQEESERRKLAYPSPFTYNSYFDCEYILPLLFETRDDIFKYLEFMGVPPNPLYAFGFGRVGCFPCIHANKQELALLPDWAWEKLIEWEKKLGRTWFPPGILPGGFPYIPTIGQVRDWCRTSYGGKQFDLFKTQQNKDAPACLSTWGICE